MQKLKALFVGGKRKVAIATGSALVVASNLSHAAAGDIDTTQAMLYIAGGAAAAALVGGAMFGLVTLIGASKKAQRSGT